MKQKITIDISANYGSEAQKKTALKAIDMLMWGFKNSFESFNQCNSINYEVTTSNIEK
jgi:hypothetical protein